MRYSKSRNAGIGRLNLTLGARNVIWIFLFHFSFVSSASWLVLAGVMSARRQAAITLSRIVFSCDGWLRRAVLISHIRIIHLQEFFFISWAGSRAKDDCYVGRTHRSLQDKLKSIVCSMFTVPNVFGAWQRLVSDILTQMDKCLQNFVVHSQVSLWMSGADSFKLISPRQWLLLPYRWQFLTPCTAAKFICPTVMFGSHNLCKTLKGCTNTMR